MFVILCLLPLQAIEAGNFLYNLYQTMNSNGRRCANLIQPYVNALQDEVKQYKKATVEK